MGRRYSTDTLQYAKLRPAMQKDFPEVTALARQQVDKITDPEILQAAFLKLVHVETPDEAKKIFFDIDKSDKKPLPPKTCVRFKQHVY